MREPVPILVMNRNAVSFFYIRQRHIDVLRGALSTYNWMHVHIDQDLTLWTLEDGIPTLRKLPYAAGLLYTVQTARYHTRRKTVYLRYGV